MTFLETERLRLRNWKETDIDELVCYRNDERCTRYQRGQLQARSDLSALIQRRMQDEFLPEGRKQLAIARKDTDELVGEMTIFIENRTITMGYTISAKYHRRGYAYEMLSAVIGLLHETYPDWEFLCFTEPENVASMNLLQKLGYEHLGYHADENAEMFGKWTNRR